MNINQKETFEEMLAQKFGSHGKELFHVLQQLSES